MLFEDVSDLIMGCILILIYLYFSMYHLVIIAGQRVIHSFQDSFHRYELACSCCCAYIYAFICMCIVYIYIYMNSNKNLVWAVGLWFESTIGQYQNHHNSKTYQYTCPLQLPYASEHTKKKKSKNYQFCNILQVLKYKFTQKTKKTIMPILYPSSYKFV